MTRLIQPLENFNYIAMELLKAILEGVGIVAHVLGFLALYAIGMAVTDWRRFEKIKHQNEEKK